MKVKLEDNLSETVRKRLQVDFNRATKETAVVGVSIACIPPAPSHFLPPFKEPKAKVMAELEW